MSQSLELYGDIDSFLRQNDLPTVTCRKLLEHLDDAIKKVYLELELSHNFIVDAGKPFVQATYVLERDGPLALKCYEVYNQFTNYSCEHGCSWTSIWW